MAAQMQKESSQYGYLGALRRKQKTQKATHATPRPYFTAQKDTRKPFAIRQYTSSVFNQVSVTNVLQLKCITCSFMLRIPPKSAVWDDKEGDKCYNPCRATLC